MMEANLQLAVAVFFIIMLIMNDATVNFTMMKLKYTLSMLHFEQSTFKILYC